MDCTSTVTEFQWFKFLGELSALDDPPTESGKIKLEETQIPDEFDKIFVLTEHDRQFFEHCVYVVDVSCNSNVHKYPIPSLEPIVRFGFPRDHEAFSIVGTKLYMFGGEVRNETRVKFSKKMSFYDMSLALSPGPTIDLSHDYLDLNVEAAEGVTGGVKGDKEVVEAAKGVTERVRVDYLENGPHMAAGKNQPISVVIGFKICVFSSTLYLHPELRFGDKYPSYLRLNFEVYDTRNDSWIQLPEPFDKLDHEITVVVDSYCVHQSSLIIQIDLGIYGINIDKPYSKWVKMVGSESLLRNFPFSGMWTKVGKLLCNPFKVVRREDLISSPIPLDNTSDENSLIEQFKTGILFSRHSNDIKSYPITLNDSRDRNSLIGGFPTGVLFSRGQNNGCIDLLSVRGGFIDDNTNDIMQVPYLLIDTVKLDAEALKKLGSDLSGWNKLQSNKSFTFSLNSTISHTMTVIGCFPLKGTDTSMEKDASKDYISKKIKDSLQWVDFVDKVTSGSWEHSLDFDTSHTKGVDGNGYLGRKHQAKLSVTNELVVGSSSRLQQVLRSSLV